MMALLKIILCKSKIFIFYLVICIVFIIPSLAYSNNRIFTLFEFLRESNNINAIYKNINKDYFKSTIYKIYAEYDITTNLTIGGYMKKYQFYHKYCNNVLNVCNEKEIDNDYYGNVFAIYDFVNFDKNTLSFKYGYSIPIQYEDFSKTINLLDTRTAMEFSLIFNNNSNIYFYTGNYFFNIELNYKQFNNLENAQILVNTKLGIKLNIVSSLEIEYEFKDFIIFNDNEERKYKYTFFDNSHQIKLSNTYKFIDNFLIGISGYYKYIDNINIKGATIFFVFDF